LLARDGRRHRVGHHSDFRPVQPSRTADVSCLESSIGRLVDNRERRHFSGNALLDTWVAKFDDRIPLAAGPNSLRLASIWWPIGFVLAAAYFVFISRRYAGKVSVQRDNQGF